MGMGVVVMQAKQKTTRKTSDIPGARLSFLSVPGGLPNGYSHTAVKNNTSYRRNDRSGTIAIRSICLHVFSLTYTEQEG